MHGPPNTEPELPESLPLSPCLPAGRTLNLVNDVCALGSDKTVFDIFIFSHPIILISNAWIACTSWPPMMPSELSI